MLLSFISSYIVSGVYKVIMVQVHTRGKHNNNQESGSKINIPCGRRFLRVLIFAVFPAICANKFPQTFFPQKLTPG